MSKEIYISSTPHETRLAIVENDALTEIYYERENEYTLAGSIYNGKVTRVLPGMQSSFVDIGLERDAFLYITDFMEEAPDSAEFDTSTLGDGNSRESRLPRLEAKAEAPPRESQPRESQPRDEQPRGDRNGRGDRGRGRGRGDRGSNGERTPGGDRTLQGDRSTQAESSRIEIEPEFEVPRIAPLAASGSEFEGKAADAAGEVSELGEGAPGAEVSRRWRGRRGRRRGRGAVPSAGTRDESPQTTSAGSESAGFEHDAKGEDAEDFDAAARTVVEAGDSEFDRDDLDEQADPMVAPPIPALSPQEQADAAPRRNEPGRLEQGRGDRTGRNDRGRNDRGGRGDRNDRPARAPRGFAPSRSLYGVDSEAAEPYGADAPAEPIILPGESLSKYRPGGEIAPASAPVAAAPSSEYTIPTGWDGGSVLPGESLSRHRRPDATPQGRAELRPPAPPAFTNRPAAPIPAPERIAPLVIQEPDGASVAETPETQPEVATAAHPELVPETETIHELSAPQAEPVAVAEPLPPTEYEPEDGFASHRVNPIAPSEYRQSPQLEEAPAEPEAGPTEAEVLESLEDREPSHDGFGNTHFLTPAPIGPEPILTPHAETATAIDAPTRELGSLIGEVYEFHPATHPAPAEPAPAPSLHGHDVTLLNPMGEMVSLPPTIEPAAETVPMEQPEPSAPIHHEAAILTPADLGNEHAEEFEEEEEPATQGFAPGSGDLEEELIEEDEYEVATLHAGYDDEMDDLEEETLEGAADLGTMLREMSIDQITRSAPEESEDAEDEEFEEEDSLEEPEERVRAFHQPEEGSEEYARTAEATGDFSNEFREPEAGDSGESRETTEGGGSYNERRGGRRDVRRGGRDREPARRGADSSGQPRNTGGGGDRERGRSGGRGRMSMQSTNLPAISELLKPGQEILVQIAKEPMAKKGARITSHIALPGRFLVFMPTVNHTGVSRKIESDGERRRLKEILLSEKGEAAGGFIVRTAASGATEEELRSDLRFLLNLWADIKNRSESSKSPALIYHDLNLVERILRDQVTDNFSAIWVDTETEYERVLRFLQRFQPGLIRRVKLYGKETPLFEQFGITEEINKALRSKVWLKSGGSIVINQTEALVAIDINTGKFVGKTARLEDTIVKTNLDAIPEIVRQIRLRDLGGIIIIDFIDMDERKNRNRVMAALEEELKSDRAPSKVLQFNDFGLVAITRKRVKQSLERTLSTTCGVCQGTGMTKSPVTVCNDIYVEMRKMYKHLDKGDVMLRVHPDVVKQLKSSGTRWLQEMEEMSGKTILVKSDPALHPEQFDIH